MNRLLNVAEGRLLFFLGDDSIELCTGDMVTVPSNQRHAIQTLTPYVRLIDTFTPIRDDLLSKKQE